MLLLTQIDVWRQVPGVAGVQIVINLRCFVEVQTAGSLGGEFSKMPKSGRGSVEVQISSFTFNLLPIRT